MAKKTKSNDIGRNTLFVVVLVIAFALIFMSMFPYTTAALLILLGLSTLVAAIGWTLGKGTLGGIISLLLRR